MNDENKIIQRLSAIYGGDMGKMLEAIRFFKINGFLPKWSNVADAVTNMCNTADSLVGRESHDALIDNIRSGPAPLYDYGQTLLKEYPSSTSSGGGDFSGSGASSSWSVDIGNPGPYDYVENIPLLDRMTFSDAYSAARRAGIGEFEFDGRTYSTDYDPNATLGPVQMGESLVGNLRNVYDADGRIIRDSTRVEPWMGQIPGRHKREHAQGGTLLLKPYNKFGDGGDEKTLVSDAGEIRPAVVTPGSMPIELYTYGISKEAPITHSELRSPGMLISKSMADPTYNLLTANCFDATGQVIGSFLGEDLTRGITTPFGIMKKVRDAYGDSDDYWEGRDYNEEGTPRVQMFRVPWYDYRTGVDIANQQRFDSLVRAMEKQGRASEVDSVRDYWNTTRPKLQYVLNEDGSTTPVENSYAQGGTLLLPYNKFEMEGPENGIGENTESAQQASEGKHENFYRRFSDKYGVLYDVANAVLYAAAPYTGGTTLPLAVLMSGAQGAGGIYDMIDNGPDWNNAIDVTSAIPGLGISQSVVKSLAKKGISKAITKNVASNVDPFSLMRVARKVAKIENVSNHALNAAQLMNDFYDMKTGKKVSEAPLLESAPPVFSGPVNVGYVTISGANPEYEELFTRGVGLKNEYQDNYRNREWSSGSIHFGGETVDFDYGYGNNYYGGAKVPVEILDYIYNASADNNIPFKALLGLAGKESTLGYGSIRQRQDLKDSISPLRLFNYDHGIGQSDIVLAKDMKRFYDILNKYYNAEKITEEDADVFSSVVDKIERENGLLHDYSGDNFVKDMWDYYQNSGMWNKSNGFRNDVLKKGEEAFGNPAFRKWWESRGYSLNNDGVAVKKVR